MTETWFRGGKDLKHRLEEIEGMSGIKYIHKSRDGRARCTGGGVAIAFDSGTCNFKQRHMKGVLKNHEVVCAVGKLAGMRRTLAIFSVYIPPRTKAADKRIIGEGIATEAAEICAKFANPVIVIGGDFNHANFGEILNDVSNFVEVDTGPTCGDNKLDLIYTNVPHDIVDARTLPPLQANNGTFSNHRCVYAECDLGQNKNFEWVVKMARKRTKEREEAFAAELSGWTIGAAPTDSYTVDAMATDLEKKILELTDKHFPLQRVRRRSNEDPWITRHIRRLWKRKLRLYKKDGRSASWWATDAQLQDAIADSKELFVEKLLEEGGSGKSFYRATKRLLAASNPKNWRVGDLFACARPGEVGVKVLEYFGRIATSEAAPMPDVRRIPGGLPPFTFESVEELLKESKKTESIVHGDPLPNMIRQFPEAFAQPVMEIYNAINDTGRWPAAWKTEYLTIIPKTPNPTDLSECRNISCTSVFSKILEGRVLDKLRKELTADLGQYGGKPKCGAEHMLIDLWERIMTTLEGGGDAALLLGIDYEKAFNRMEHSVCLAQLRRLGASDNSVSLIRAFLEGRRMTISIDGVMATPIPINRGSPQGSVLGCLLYCVTTQSLTSELKRAGDVPIFFPQDGPEDEPVNMWGGEEKGPEAFLYVDDTTIFNAASLSNATRHITTGTTVENLSCPELGQTFVDLERRAEEIGMKINKKKTQLLIISPRNGCATGASMPMGDNEVVQSQDEMKLVGFTFGDTPGVSKHVEQIRDKFRRKVWMLYHLRKAGFRDYQLYRLYCCYVRTVVEYCSVVYHSLLNKGQEEDLERLHRHAVRICYGSNTDAAVTMTLHGIETLKARRERRCDKFILKAAANPRFRAAWFQRRPESGHHLRRRRNIMEPRAATLRRFNSPLSYIRRRANQLGITGL